LRVLYGLLIHIAALVAAPVLTFKGLFKDRAFLNFLGIFGEDASQSDKRKSIWIHASSVGEVKAAMLLIEKLAAERKDIRTILTVFTPRGMKVARQETESNADVHYFPLDIPFVVRKVFSRFDPGMLVLIETELWPNVMREAIERGVSLAIINGRLSDRNFKRYFALRAVFSPILERVDFVHTQSTEDAERFIELGSSASSVVAGNNLKISGMLSNLRRFDKAAVMSNIGLDSNVRVIVCGSTRPGEEEILIRAFKQVSTDFSSVKLMLAPRHLDRVPDIEGIVSDSGLKSIKRSELPSTDLGKVEVIILDTLGELWKMYGIGVCAFVGGSLVPIGGHNPLEPIALGIPTFFGPHMENTRELTAACLDKGFAYSFDNADEIAQFMADCLKGEISGPSPTEVASQFASDLDSATHRLLEIWDGRDA